MVDRIPADVVSRETSPPKTMPPHSRDFVAEGLDLIQPVLEMFHVKHRRLRQWIMEVDSTVKRGP